MTKRRYRALLVASHPTQYGSPQFRRMAQHPQLEIQVAYCSLQGAEAAVDPDFGVSVSWDVPLLDGYSWVHVPNRSPRPRLGSFFGILNPGLWKLIRGGGFDAVILFTGYACASFWIAIASAKSSGTALLFGTDATTLRPRGAQSWKVPLKSVLLPIIFRLADVALAPSEGTIQFFRTLGIPKERVVFTPFVVDNDWWIEKANRVDRADARVQWDLPGNCPVVLFCAKFQPWKRPQDVLRAFAKAEVPDAILAMAGDGPLRASLELESRTLGIADKVRFLGFVPQTKLPGLYRSADLMVLPSEYDACPTVVCEAMICGCPVVLSDEIRGRFELVQPGDTGFIFSCGNVDELARILREILPDKRSLKRMSDAARTRMETWSPRENVEGMLSAVRTAAKSKHQKL
jgi:glycosyltransferase involved in cell wall biosynthesis